MAGAGKISGAYLDTLEHLDSVREVHGTDGSLPVPGPNGFEGQVEYHGAGGGWGVLPVSAGRRGAGRGTGLADLAEALTDGRPHRAPAELARHVLDVLLTLLDSAHRGGALPVASGCAQPEAVSLS